MKPDQPYKTILPWALIALFVLIVILIISTKPSASRHAPAAVPQIEVSTRVIAPQTFTISLQSYGTVQALNHTALTSRVAGTVEFVAEKARAGGSFKQGERLLSLEKADYQIELDIARAQVAEAQSRYASEVALAQEARYDWQRSGREGEPPALAVRDPQLKAAKAALISAEAAQKRAELNLSRTDIVAPYDGSVKALHVDLGQYISPNTPVAEIFSTDAAELTLPIKQDELPLLGVIDTLKTNAPKVLVRSTLESSGTWQGTLVRITKVVDEQSRQLLAVARIPSPFQAHADGTAPLRVGEYVTASIAGKSVENAIVIPVHTIYQGRYVYVLEDDGAVYRRPVEIAWSDTQSALISQGLTAGDALVLTALGQVPSGTAVRTADSNSAPNSATNKPEAHKESPAP